MFGNSKMTLNCLQMLTSPFHMHHICWMGLANLHSRCFYACPILPKSHESWPHKHLLLYVVLNVGCGTHLYAPIKW